MTTSKCFQMITFRFIVINLMIILLGNHVAESRKNTPLLVEDDGTRRNNRPAGKRYKCTTFSRPFSWFYISNSMANVGKNWMAINLLNAATRRMCWLLVVGAAVVATKKVNARSAPCEPYMESKTPLTWPVISISAAEKISRVCVFLCVVRAAGTPNTSSFTRFA